MAKQTDINLRTTVFYQVFLRQHSKEQNFEGLIKDLDRIKTLGVDVLYLLPIHPIGKKSRKGSKGSPYSIMDFLAVNPDLGTMTDFKNLVVKIHEKGMKVMIDIVFNHTSRDSVLVKNHPGWFYRDEKGEFINRVGEWSDITDLDLGKKEVRSYLIDVLRFWSNIVDGFRCDVAPLLPIEFWIDARHQIDKINPEIIWLAESTEPSFIKYLRDEGHKCSSDSESYLAFDICYDYDIFRFMDEYLEDGKKLSRWLDQVYLQESIYSHNFIKLRSFENHDQKRLRSKVRDRQHFIQMIALMFFFRGTPLIYGGQEHEIEHKPDLFETDLVSWNKKKSLEPFIKILTKIKKMPIFIYGKYNMHNSIDIAVLSYTFSNQFLLGIFNLEKSEQVNVPLLDGKYKNLLTPDVITVKNGIIALSDLPIIIDTVKEYIK